MATTIPSFLLVWVVTGWLLIAPDATAAGSTPFADDAFQSTWERTDRPVAEGVVGATWIWGPAPRTDAVWEPYAESPGGQRLVQYFDKSRMELTHPGDESGSPWHVTNGLLATELITGRMQAGDDDFSTRFPSETPVAGDAFPRNGPSYATFTRLLDLPDDRWWWEEPLYVNRVGETVIERLTWDGWGFDEPELAEHGVTLAVFDEVTEQNIAEPFWSFMTSSRTVFVDGQYVEAPLFENPYYATGRPLTEPTGRTSPWPARPGSCWCSVSSDGA